MSPSLRFRYLRYRLLHKALRFLVPLCLNVRITGRKNAPKKGPFILVSNHRFDLDAFLVSYAVEAPLTWLAADFLKRLPFTAWVIRLFGMITVSKLNRRDNNFMSLGKIMSCLRDGGNIALFPEGMDYLIAADFSRPMARFASGFAKIACKLNLPVYPVTLVPERERVHRYPIPRSIRRLFRLAPALQDIPLRNTYRSVTIAFLLPLSPNLLLPKKQRVADLLQRVRRVMEENLSKGRLAQ